MNKNSILIFLFISMQIPFIANGQKSSILKSMKDKNVFSSFELAANIGTTGLGLEIASPVTDWTKVRLGFDCMPHFKRNLQFSVVNHIDDRIGDNFDRINEMISNQTGYQINKDIMMQSKPTMNTFRFLVDVYPFRANRNWHVTAGFFLGGNSIGTTMNTAEDMASIMGIKMFDILYENAMSDDFVNNPQDYPLFGILTFTEKTAKEFQEKIRRTGQLGVYAGERKDGSPCILLPDEDGIMKLKTKVNNFRPYLGFGYSSSLSRDNKWQASFDAGVQFWGGTPKLTANDGTVINDLTNLSEKTKSYINLMHALPVYPTLDFRISYRF